MAAAGLIVQARRSGVFRRAGPSAIVGPLAVLAALAVVLVGVATVVLRRDLTQA